MKSLQILADGKRQIIGNTVIIQHPGVLKDSQRQVNGNWVIKAYRDDNGRITSIEYMRFEGEHITPHYFRVPNILNNKNVNNMLNAEIMKEMNNNNAIEIDHKEQLKAMNELKELKEDSVELINTILNSPFVKLDSETKQAIMSKVF